MIECKDGKIIIDVDMIHKEKIKEELNIRINDAMNYGNPEVAFALENFKQWLNETLK